MSSIFSVPRRALPIIRVFVSSTFSDLKHERNALHAKVWPELERYCQQRGFTFQAIDLRWGVPAEAGLDHRTMRICFEELRRSQETSPEPNFLILLGNRYGWRPLPEVISVEEFEKLKTAAEQIQIELPDPTKHLSNEQVELLAKAVSVLEDWYLLDENAKPFGEKFPIGEYILRSRKPLLNGVDYGRQPDAAGILRDTAAWVDVQFVLWSIVNRAFPASGLKDRFTAPFRDDAASDRSGTRESTDLKSHDFSYADRKPLPSSVRFHASATEQEIWHGALHAQGTEAKQHVIAWFREIDNLSDYPPGPQLKDFVDLKDGETPATPDLNSKQALEQLKTELKQNLDAKNVFTAKCRWNGEKQGPSVPDVATDHLDEMCKQIRERLKEMIILQINAYWGCDLSADDATLTHIRGSQQELDLECADHLRFAGERAPEKTFVGRETELQRIRDYLHSETNQPFVVHGPSGSGKTALLGKIIQQVTPSRSADGMRAKTGPIVLTRFIGTTPESSNLRSLLSSLCRELRQDFEMPAPLPTDLNELIGEFYSQLGKATAARPVFVFLDALDQLDAADHGRSVFWLRSPLASITDASCYARMIVSCLSPSDEFPEDSEACEPFRELKLRTLLSNHELGALDENDARQLFANWLLNAGRSLSETQQDMIWSAIQKSSACRQPLFLKVLFEEAKLWRSYDSDVRLNEPETSNDYVGALLKQLFDRLSLEVYHGKLLVERALGYIAAARRGLSEEEVLEVLFADREFRRSILKTSFANKHRMSRRPKRIPIAIWSRLRSDLAPYLTARAAPGGNVLTLYHRQIAKWVEARFVDATDWNPHRRAAEYFAAQRLNLRKVDELPWQLAKAKSWLTLSDALRDLPFLEAAWRANRFEVTGYWAEIEQHSHRRLVDAYQELANVHIVAENADLVWNVARLLDDSGHGDRALVLWQRLIAYGRRTGDIKRLAGALGNAAIRLKDQGTYDVAWEFLREQEQVCVVVGDRYGLQNCLGNQGLVAARLGKLDESMALHKEKERICRAIGHRLGIAASLGNQALILCAHDLGGALALHYEEMQLCREIGDREGVARSLSNQAMIYEDMGKAEQALALLCDSEHVSRELGSKVAIAKCLMDQARIVQKKDETKLEFSSLEKYLQAEAIYRDIADHEGLATCLHGVSRMHILLKQPHEALACLDEAQDLFHECSNDDGFEACLLNRAIVMLGWDNQMGLELLVEQEGRLRESQNDRYLIQCLLTQVPVLMRVGKTAEALGKSIESEVLCCKTNDRVRLALSLDYQAQIRGTEVTDEA